MTFRHEEHYLQDFSISFPIISCSQALPWELYTFLFHCFCTSEEQNKFFQASPQCDPTWFSIALSGQEAAEAGQGAIELINGMNCTMTAFLHGTQHFNYPFKAVIAGIVVFVFQLVNNVLQGLRLTLFLKEVTQ